MTSLGTLERLLTEVHTLLGAIVENQIQFSVSQGRIEKALAEQGRKLDELIALASLTANLAGKGDPGEGT